MLHEYNYSICASLYKFLRWNSPGILMDSGRNLYILGVLEANRDGILKIDALVEESDSSCQLASSNILHYHICREKNWCRNPSLYYASIPSIFQEEHLVQEYPYMHHLTDYDRKKSWNIDCKCFSFFRNDVLPIVMGAAPEDYKRAAPYHSFIHVDEFETPKDLAEYLYKVDKNDTLYNEYFRWKGTGENINTFFWCRICSMIHEVGENNHSLVYHDLDRWWRGPGVCIGQSRWRDNRKTRDNVIINKYGLGFGNWSFQQKFFITLGSLFFSFWRDIFACWSNQN